MATLMLVDGNSVTYRAFFALPTDIALASGQITNAVYGFTSMLLNMVRDHRPDTIVVAFDRPEPTFRHERFEAYKTGRTAAPDILREQMGLVRQVIETLDIPALELPGYEADDIIATLATRARDRGDTVLIVTGDRDVFQLVEDPHIRVLYMRRGVSDAADYDEAGIIEKAGVPPRLYPQYAALRGDPSDALPGVPGVGEKTAAKLLNTYGGLDGIFEHLDEQSPKLRQNLAAAEEQVRLNHELSILDRNVPIDFDLDALEPPAFDREAVRKLFDFLEFRTLHDRFAEAFPASGGTGAAPGGVEVLEAEVREVATPAEAVEVLGGLAGAERVVLAGRWVGAEVRTPLEGVAVVVDPEGADVAWVPAEVLADPAVRAAVEGLPPIAAHGAKALLRSLAGLGITLPPLAIDTQIAAYLLDPAESRYLLEELLVRYAGLRLPEEGSAAAAGQLDLDGGDVPPALATARRALATDRLAQPLLAALDAQGLRNLHDTIEIPLVRVLAKMEDVGVGVDVDELRRLNETMKAECAQLTTAIWEAAGEEFNVNSTPKLREILFEKLGLQPSKRTKTGYSTDAASLEKLKGQHVIIDHLLRYREVEKLRSTYGEGLLAEVGPDGRIHATFNQTVARTGRLSSDQPNLHNIPVRSEEGRQFRRAFIASPGCLLLVADYNQIELRCIAHLAQDPGLIEAFESGQDIHSATASRIFGVEPSEVTLDQRSKAKMVSYGLAYGMEAYGLGQRLNIPTSEAKVILDAYFEAFPNVKAYMERTVREARLKGYTETLFGRRRQIPELLSDRPQVRMAGERQAMNAGIQGLAADIFKVALVKLDRALEESELESRLILQVHDEVLLDVPEAELEQARDLTVEAMATAADLDVPLAVNVAWGPTWADAKG